MSETRASALAKVKRAVARRRQALKDKSWRKARSALRVARKYRAVAQSLRGSRAIRCGRTKHTFRSVKNFFSRPRITPRVVILHSTESSPGSGYNIGSYLSHGSTQADVHVVIDTDGTRYRLVPDGRKAWHVGARNGDTLGIEQVGRAKQESWPDAQVRAAACQTAKWCRKYNIPVVHDAQHGIAYHRDVSGPGGHWDPGYHYPMKEFLALVRKYLAA